MTIGYNNLNQIKVKHMNSEYNLNNDNKDDYDNEEVEFNLDDAINLVVEEDDVETESYEETEIKTAEEFLSSTAKKAHYLNDHDLTTQLLREAKEYKDYAAYKELILKNEENKDIGEPNEPEVIGEYTGVKRESPSNDMCLKFMRIYDGIIRKPNFSGYTSEYKEEFFSKAQYLFIRHWFKFDPLKVRKNYRVAPHSKLDSIDSIAVERSKNGVKLREKIDAGELVVKKVEEYEGGFSWLTMLCMTACTDSITMFKQRREKHRELVQSVVDKNTSSGEHTKFDYYWIDL